MKKSILILSSLFIMFACNHSSSSTQQVSVIKKPNAVDIIEENQRESKKLTRPCVETEGDYETPSKCIHIENKCPLPEDDIVTACGVYSMTIIDKKTAEKFNTKAKNWVGEEIGDFYGYQAMTNNRLYEIDLRHSKNDLNSKDPIYYREWNKNKTKKLFEEKVIVQP